MIANRIARTASVFAFAALALTAGPAKAEPKIEAGLLTCNGQGGWGQIIASKREFICDFVSLSNKPLGQYRGVITRFGLDLGFTGQETVVWGVLAPGNVPPGPQLVGALEGNYVGVGADASVGVGLGANALVGGGSQTIALQPISVEAKTGLNLAVGVQQLSLVLISGE